MSSGINALNLLDLAKPFFEPVSACIFDTRHAVYLSGGPTFSVPGNSFYKLASSQDVAGSAIWRPKPYNANETRFSIETAQINTSRGSSKVSFYLLEDESVLVPSRSLSVFLPSLRSVIDDYHEIGLNPTMGARPCWMRGLILMEVAYQTEMRQDIRALNPCRYAHQNLEAMAQDGPNGVKRLEEITFLWSMHHLRRSPALSTLHDVLAGVDDYGTFTYAIAQEAGIPDSLIARVTLDPPTKSVLFSNKTPFHYADYLLTMLRMTRHPNPWKVLGSLEKEGFQSGFGLVPEKASDIKLSRKMVLELRRIGLGGLVNEARSKRGWTLEELKASIDRCRAPRAGLGYDRLAAILNHVERADKPTLDDILKGINAGLDTPLVTPRDAVIANWPRFPFLTNEDVAKSAASARLEAASRRRSRTKDGKVKGVRIYHKNELDPHGMPFLIQSAAHRKSLGMNDLTKLLGVGASVVDRLFQDPIFDEGGIAHYTPSRNALRDLMDPKALDMSLIDLLKAAYHSYWNSYSPAKTIQTRSPWGPLFFDALVRDRMKEYARGVYTQGEFLFGLRHSTNPSFKDPKLFLPSSGEFAHTVGMTVDEYERCERNLRPLMPGEVVAVSEALGLKKNHSRRLMRLASSQRSRHLDHWKREMLQKYPQWKGQNGLIVFLALLHIQWPHYRRKHEEIAERILWMQETDLASFQYIDKIGEALTGETLEETKKLQVSIWRCHKFLQKWPTSTQRQGPSIAFYYAHYKGAEAVFLKLERAVKNKKVISFQENGSWAHQ